MQQSEFQVTLPSTSSNTFFPQNKPSHYNTMLKSPLQLEGEWEVALMDIQYPINWHNFPGAEVAIIFKMKQSGSRDLTFSPQSSQPPQMLRRPQGEESVASRELRSKAIIYYHQRKIEYTAIVIVKLPPGHYKSAEALMETFTASFNYDEGMMEAHMKIFSIYNPSTKVARLSFENMEYCDLICRESAFLQASGIKGEDIGNNYFYYRILGLLKAPSELPTISTMYVYTDIIKWQRVGDNEAPLLATLPIQGNPEQQVFWGFNPPYYVPVSQETINTIEIKLTTDEGDDFPIRIPGKVICRLHFRRRRYNL